MKGSRRAFYYFSAHFKIQSLLKCLTMQDIECQLTFFFFFEILALTYGPGPAAPEKSRMIF